MSKKIGVVAVQGAFIEHEKILSRLGAQCIELRQAADVQRSFDALVLPGGESTAQSKMLHDLGMFDALRSRIASGMPVLGTCAGLILLADKVFSQGEAHEDERVQGFKTLPVSVCRNAYGRQLGSFRTVGAFAGMQDVPMTFIRAPYVKECAPGVEVLAEVDGRIVAVQYRNMLGLSFHPELDDDFRVHQMFLDLA